MNILVSDLLDLLDKFGPWVGILLIIVIGIIPAIRDKLVPGLIELLKTRDTFQRQIELDRLASAQKTDRNIDALASAMVQMTTQITTILNNQTNIRELQMDTLKALNDGISAMRENVARREGYAKGKAEHKTGDTGPLKAEP